MERIKSNQDPFLKRLSRNIPAKYEVNNTPIRQRDHNKENRVFTQNRSNKDHKNMQEPETHSPSYTHQSSIGNSRTIPKRKVSTQTILCVNHNDCEAEFKIVADGDSLNYCNKCAAHLASNGFKVERIMPARSPRRVKEMGRVSGRRKQELSNFIENLKNVEQGYTETADKLTRIQSSHQIEKETITNFYSSLFEYMEYIRDEHLSFLGEEAKRSTQICEIEGAEVVETLEEIKAMREDIEQNVGKIVDQDEVQEENYIECMTYYNQKKGVHQTRLEELGNEARLANCTTAECVEEKLSEFKYFIDELTGILSSKAESVEY